MKGGTKEDGVAAPIASQVLGEVLPYLEIQKEEIEEKVEVEVPELIGLNLKDAKEKLKELGLELNNEKKNDIKINEIETKIINQLPKKGIKIIQGNKVIVEIEE